MNWSVRLVAASRVLGVVRSLAVLCACCGAAVLVGQAVPVRPPITGIAFVNFAVTDVAAADRFYAGTLGLREISSADAKSLGSLTIYEVNRHQWISVAKDKPNRVAGTGRLGAVGFRTTSAAQMGAYLAAHGYPAVRPVTDGELVVKDPEGNTVCFMEDGAIAAVAHANTSPTAASQRIIHAGFVVRDAAAENRFWRETLGFRPYWHGGHDDEATDYVSQQVPEGTDWVEYMLHVSPAADARQLGGANHVSLGVERMATVEAQLAANHCAGAACGKAQTGRDGKVQLNVFDPDLTRVEFMEFKPSGTTCCSAYTGAHPAAGDEHE